MEQLISGIVALLRQKGMRVAEAMPSTPAPRLDAPACVVQMASAQLAPPGFAQYLGVLEDAERGQIELYGARMEATAEIRVYSPTALGASACRAAVAEIVDALMQADAEWAAQNVQIGPCSYDAQYDHFTAAVQIGLRTWVYATSAEDAQTFTKFNLRGELQ